MWWWQYVWLLGGLAWALPSPDRQCPGNMECRNKFQCPVYLDSVEHLKSLTNGTTEYTNLHKKLTESICNRKERAVCCEKNYEVVGGTEITDVNEYSSFLVMVDQNHIQNLFNLLPNTSVCITD